MVNIELMESNVREQCSICAAEATGTQIHLVQSTYPNFDFFLNQLIIMLSSI